MSLLYKNNKHGGGQSADKEGFKQMIKKKEKKDHKCCCKVNIHIFYYLATQSF